MPFPTLACGQPHAPTLARRVPGPQPRSVVPRRTHSAERRRRQRGHGGAQRPGACVPATDAFAAAALNRCEQIVAEYKHGRVRPVGKVHWALARGRDGSFSSGADRARTLTCAGRSTQTTSWCRPSRSIRRRAGPAAFRERAAPAADCVRWLRWSGARVGVRDWLPADRVLHGGRQASPPASVSARKSFASPSSLNWLCPSSFFSSSCRLFAHKSYISDFHKSDPSQARTLRRALVPVRGRYRLLTGCELLSAERCVLLPRRLRRCDGRHGQHHARVEPGRQDAGRTQGPHRRIPVGHIRSAGRSGGWLTGVGGALSDCARPRVWADRCVRPAAQVHRVDAHGRGYHGTEARGVHVRLLQVCVSGPATAQRVNVRVCVADTRRWADPRCC
jgi:hypothetical protein